MRDKHESIKYYKDSCGRYYAHKGRYLHFVAPYGIDKKYRQLMKVERIDTPRGIVGMGLKKVPLGKVPHKMQEFFGMAILGYQKGKVPILKEMK